MELNQVLDLQLTQEETDKMAELLGSDNVPKILFLMMRSFASRSDENVKFLMKTITELANTTIDRANTAVLKKQKVIESMEAIMPLASPGTRTEMPACSPTSSPSATSRNSTTQSSHTLPSRAAT